ncbi:MAG: intradiol ring-cleavage dioxygenase [Chitinophagaceae bacterium]|nr:MAG: intradiol ring-cleavage dioxygenase [Chitinophagaceae bacterium]
MKRKTFLTALTLLPLYKAVANLNVRFFSQSCKTQKDQEGPFYKKGSPVRTVIEQGGTLLTIKGKILKASDCATPVANATLDIWHCDSEGNYDNQGFKCRGMVQADSSGNYTFATIFPPPYGSRPRHIHFKVRADGYPELTSQIYFKGDPKISNDFARNAEADRVIEVQKVDDQLSGQFNIFI